MKVSLDLKMKIKSLWLDKSILFKTDLIGYQI